VSLNAANFRPVRKLAHYAHVPLFVVFVTIVIVIITIVVIVVVKEIWPESIDWRARCFDRRLQPKRCSQLHCHPQECHVVSLAEHSIAWHVRLVDDVPLMHSAH
jgi:hypothetical protein